MKSQEVVEQGLDTLRVLTEEVQRGASELADDFSDGPVSELRDSFEKYLQSFRRLTLRTKQHLRTLCVEANEAGSDRIDRNRVLQELSDFALNARGLAVGRGRRVTTSKVLLDSKELTEALERLVDLVPESVSVPLFSDGSQAPKKPDLQGERGFSWWLFLVSGLRSSRNIRAQAAARRAFLANAGAIMDGLLALWVRQEVLVAVRTRRILEELIAVAENMLEEPPQVADQRLEGFRSLMDDEAARLSEDYASIADAMQARFRLFMGQSTQRFVANLERKGRTTWFRRSGSNPEHSSAQKSDLEPTHLEDMVGLIEGQYQLLTLQCELQSMRFRGLMGLSSVLSRRHREERRKVGAQVARLVRALAEWREEAESVSEALPTTEDAHPVQCARELWASLVDMEGRIASGALAMMVDRPIRDLVDQASERYTVPVWPIDCGDWALPTRRDVGVVYFRALFDTLVAKRVQTQLEDTITGLRAEIETDRAWAERLYRWLLQASTEESMTHGSSTGVKWDDELTHALEEAKALQSREDRWPKLLDDAVLGAFRSSSYELTRRIDARRGIGLSGRERAAGLWRALRRAQKAVGRIWARVRDWSLALSQGGKLRPVSPEYIASFQEGAWSVGDLPADLRPLLESMNRAIERSRAEGPRLIVVRGDDTFLRGILASSAAASRIYPEIRSLRMDRALGSDGAVAALQRVREELRGDGLTVVRGFEWLLSSEVGAFRSLETFFEFVHTESTTTWVIDVDPAVWSHAKALFPFDAVGLKVIDVPRLTQSQLAEMIKRRHQASERDVFFDVWSLRGLRAWAFVRKVSDSRAVQALRSWLYFRELRRVSGGYLDVACRIWLDTIRLELPADRLSVGLKRLRGPGGPLEGASLDDWLLLGTLLRRTWISRSVLRSDWGPEAADEVERSLTRLLDAGWLESEDDGYRLDLRMRAQVSKVLLGKGWLCDA